MKYVTKVQDREYQIEIAADGQITVDGQPVAVDLQPVDAPNLYSLLLDHLSYEVYVEEEAGDIYHVLLRGQQYPVQVREQWTHGLDTDRLGWGPATKEMAVRSPMPGVVETIAVAVGDQVYAGDLLLVLETMKMENELRASRAGTVKAIHVQVGDAVGSDQDLLVLG
ncbi:MAG: biotin/lipoyl-binding protein [Chloroflexi bacterium]|nr:biotin/lipoyl-binding protein [Chloroflexota bacterium]